MESYQRCVTQEDWCVIPAAKKEKASPKKEPKQPEWQQHIAFLYDVVEELKEKLEKVLGRLGL